MDAVVYCNFRRNLRDYMKQVNTDSNTLIVTAKQPEDTIVVMGKHDYDALQETMHLLSSPKTMNEIHRGIEQFNAGEGTQHELLDDDGEQDD